MQKPLCRSGFFHRSFVAPARQTINPCITKVSFIAPDAGALRLPPAETLDDLCGKLPAIVSDLVEANSQCFEVLTIGVNPKQSAALKCLR